MPGDTKLKTFADSYLSNSGNANKIILTLKEYINTAQRVDKSSEAFRGILEDIKRQRSASILYTVLKMPNVQLMINEVEMPRAYKVIDAKDVKNGNQNTVFIDCTGLISFHDGFYTCSKTDVLATYLACALVYLIYRNNQNKLLNNQIIVSAGTECYVSLFTYIIDYLRIIGFSASRTKISYLAALFFLVNMMGKELDSYTKNIAAKVAGIDTANINAYDLYIEDNMFTDINSLITSIAKQFKLKGFTTEVFFSKWNRLIGNGTYYAVDLFTSFANLIISAYFGAYVVNQKQIEQACAQNMVKFTTQILSVGSTSVTARFREAGEMDPKDPATIALAESMIKKAIGGDKFTRDDFADESVVEKIKNNINYLNETHQSEKISRFGTRSLNECITYMNETVDQYKLSGKSYDNGTLVEVAKVLKNKLSDSDLRKVNECADNATREYNSLLENGRGKYNQEYATHVSNMLRELRDIRAYI
jgi:hypothetical protein